MKNFFKNRTWDDYLIMLVIGILVLGFALLFIGFYMGFEPDSLNAIGKLSVNKVMNNEFNQLVVGLPSDHYNLFSLAGAVDPSFGTLYAMVVVAVLGFSFIMLAFAIIVTVIIVGFIYDMVMRKKAKKQA